jgi:hypothetical protein
MKHIYIMSFIIVTLLTISGCTLSSELKQQPTNPQPTTQQPLPQTSPPLAETTTAPATGLAEYHGSYFDITYPATFTARPAFPTGERDGVLLVVTDEAYFTSPDKTVEFFVYSPQWGGEPENYLIEGDNESFLSESEDPSATTDTVVFRATVKANDGSYFRSWESTRNQLGDTQLHKVFGIKYKDQAAYNKYQADYLAFKKSLVQSAD